MNIPDDVRDTILTVVMAKLLMAQKLTQFRGLCDKNNVSFKLVRKSIILDMNHTIPLFLKSDIFLE